MSYSRRRAGKSVRVASIRALCVIAVLCQKTSFTDGAKPAVVATPAAVVPKQANGVPKKPAAVLPKPAAVLPKPAAVLPKPAVKAVEPTGQSPAAAEPMEEAKKFITIKVKKKLAPYPTSFYPIDLTNQTGGIIENPVLVFEGHPTELVIPCVPKGDKAPKNKQTFDWRFMNGKGIPNNDRFRVDLKSGNLTIINPDGDTDGYYKCNVVMPDESIRAFRHTVMTVIFPVFKTFASIYGVVRTKCEVPATVALLSKLDQQNQRTLCPLTTDVNTRFTSLNCPYEFTFDKSDQYLKLRAHPYITHAMRGRGDRI